MDKQLYKRILGKYYIFTQGRRMLSMYTFVWEWTIDGGVSGEQTGEMKFV